MLNKLEHEFMLWLYERYISYLFFAAGKFTDSQPDREDLVHDALLRLMKNVSVLQGLEHKALAGYLYLTVRSVWLDRRSKEQPLSADMLEYLAEHESEEQYLAKWDTAALKEKLSERDWFLLYAKYILGCTDAQISGILGCSQASVRSLLSRVRQRAKAILEDKESLDHEK